MLVLSAVLCAALGCSRAGKSAPERSAEPKPLQLTSAVDGLPPQHLKESPLVERVNCPPRSNCLTSRVYRDGTLYYLAATDAMPLRWNRIGRLSPEGVQSLEKLYASLCGQVDPVMANDQGSELHRVSVAGCTQEFVVTGIPEGKLARIREATDIVNRSILPGSGASP